MKTISLVLTTMTVMTSGIACKTGKTSNQADLASNDSGSSSGTFFNRTNGQVYTRSGGTVFSSQGSPMHPIGGNYYVDQRTGQQVLILPANVAPNQSIPRGGYAIGNSTNGDSAPRCPDDQVCVGDAVQITNGALTNFWAAIDSIDEKADRYEAEIEVFGRSTPVVLHKNEFRKISSSELYAATISNVHSGSSNQGFQSGDTVKIVDGAYQDFVGTVQDKNPKTGRYTVVVELFGRQTPLDLDAGQLTKAK